MHNLQSDRYLIGGGSVTFRRERSSATVESDWAVRFIFSAIYKLGKIISHGNLETKILNQFPVEGTPRYTKDYARLPDDVDLLALVTKALMGLVWFEAVFHDFASFFVKLIKK